MKARYIVLPIVVVLLVVVAIAVVSYITRQPPKMEDSVFASGTVEKAPRGGWSLDVLAPVCMGAGEPDNVVLVLTNPDPGSYLPPDLSISIQVTGAPDNEVLWTEKNQGREFRSWAPGKVSRWVIILPHPYASYLEDAWTSRKPWRVDHLYLSGEVRLGDAPPLRFKIPFVWGVHAL